MNSVFINRRRSATSYFSARLALCVKEYQQTGGFPHQLLSRSSNSIREVDPTITLGSLGVVDANAVMQFVFLDDDDFVNHTWDWNSWAMLNWVASLKLPIEQHADFNGLEGEYVEQAVIDYGE